MKKFIKITNRCIVMTSRGILRAPILTPFKEDTSMIYVMLVRNKANVYEVLPDGRSIKLTVDNFDKDNSGINKNSAPSKNTARVQSAPQIFAGTDETVTKTPVSPVAVQSVSDEADETSIASVTEDNTSTPVTTTNTSNKKYSSKKK